MDSAEPAGKVSTLESQLAAKSSRIAELEARVSLLEVENARLRRAMARGEALDLIGEEDPLFGRLEEAPGAYKVTAAEKEDEAAGCGVLVLSDGEEGIAVDANKGRSPDAGVAAIPTTRKRALRIVTGESEELEGGSGNKGIAHGDSNRLLEDDDVLITTRDKKHATAPWVVTSDSEDEDGGELERVDEGNKGEACSDSNVSLEDDDVSDTALPKKLPAARVVTRDTEGEDIHVGELGSGEDDDGDDKEGVVMPSRRKRVLRRVSDSENEDSDEGVANVAGSKRASVTVVESEDEDDYPILLKKFRKKRVSGDGDDKLGDAQGCSTPTTRRSARLVKKRQAAPHVLNYVEPKEREASEGEMEEDDDMDDFINDGDPSEDASDSAQASRDEPDLSHASAVNEESSPELEESDSVINYKEVMDCIGRKKKDKDWVLEGDMLAAFRQNPELCLKAVCALYRKQTEDEQYEKSALFHNKQGFSQIHATRGSFIADFLLDGDPHGPVKKTVDDLEVHDSSALGFCQMAASHYSKQLFAIYQNKEDPYFHP